MTLIGYISKHGATQQCAILLEQRLKDTCRLVDLKKEELGDLESYDAVILGFSVHAGSIPKKIKSIAENNIATLKSKRFGLFCSCLSKEDEAIEYFHKNFSTNTIKGTKTIGVFGGAVYFEKMNVIERFIMKKLTKTDKSYSTISEESIEEFVRLFEQD